MHRNSHAQHTKESSLLHSIGIAAGFVVACLAAEANAFRFDIDNRDLEIYWDNTIRLNAGWRIEDIDDAIINNPALDESDYKFKQNDMIQQRADLLTEFDLIWKGDYGGRITAAAWYDHAYDDTEVKQNPVFKQAGFESAYYDNQYSSLVKNYYRGPYGEVLDAFLFANHTIGGIPVSAKAGQLSTFWGMALFYPAGIADNQQPIDGWKAAATPGTEVKEVFRPLKQVDINAQLTPTIGVEAQYYFDWDNTRVPEGGTFLAPGDYVGDAPDTTGTLRPGVPPLKRQKAVKPGKSGNWGVAVKFNPEWLQGQTVGLYYREYDEKVGWLTVNPDFSGYRWVYPTNTSVAGISFDGSIGAFAVGAEVGYHMDAGLKTPTLTPTKSGASGDTWHALINTIYLLPQTALFDTGSLAAELSYDRLDSVTKRGDLFQYDGDPACTRPGGEPGSGDASWGCATRDAWGIGISLTPQWLQVLPSLDLSLPLRLTMGLDGNSAVLSGVNEKAGAWSAGVELKYNVIHYLTIAYADVFADRHVIDGVLAGGNGSNASRTDRGRITITYKVAF